MTTSTATADSTRPNVIVIFCDDLGYGDLGCFGHPTIATPQLDRMAGEGQKWTQFYAAAPVCTPSRAALQTGRLPVRRGRCGKDPRVLFPTSKGGLPPDEITIGRMLKDRGYATHTVGKWHLGHQKQFLPTNHGYDSYFGIPYSNDMDTAKDVPPWKEQFAKPRSEYWNVPLMRDEHIVQRPADQTTLTKRYTEETIKLIRKNREQPFFIYLAHNLPHVPLFTDKQFKDVSRRGLYGDVIEEIDWSVGEILKTLKELKLDEKTFVVFTSDNGPWLSKGKNGGSAKPLRDGKFSTYEGGMRVPCVMRWPGQVPAGKVCAEVACTLDVLPTFAKLAGAKLPADRVIDGKDIWPLASGQDGAKSPRPAFCFFRGNNLQAVRGGQWKLHFARKGAALAPKALYDLSADIGEQTDVLKDHPDVAAKLLEQAEEIRANINENKRPVGQL
ncbi:MAG: sulfatase [Planctomycetales bacterium]